MGYSKAKKVAYLVFEGRTIGLFEKWAERSVTGYPGARFKGYYSAEEAFAVWDRFEADGTILDAKPPRKAPPVYKPKKAKGPRKLIPLAEYIARHEEKNGAGSFQHTCTANACTYPACMCITR